MHWSVRNFNYIREVDASSELARVSTTKSQLLVDTGSSNTWVGAGKAFVKTSTSVQTVDKVVRMFPLPTTNMY